MTITSSNTVVITFLGYLFLIAGIAGMIADFVSRSEFGFPLDMGIVLGNGAFIAVGLIGTMSAKSLKELNRRVRQLEGSAGRS